MILAPSSLPSERTSIVLARSNPVFRPNPCFVLVRCSDHFRVHPRTALTDCLSLLSSATLVRLQAHIASSNTDGRNTLRQASPAREQSKGVSLAGASGETNNAATLLRRSVANLLAESSRREKRCDKSRRGKSLMPPPLSSVVWRKS